MVVDTLIVGGGLSGLSLATQLTERGHEALLVEARDRFGGRILTERVDDGFFDLGPAWFWAGQPRIDALIGRLGLERFEQYYDGALCFEDENGRVQRGWGRASMQGSFRLKGGFGALTSALAAQLPEGRKMLSTQIIALEQTHDGVAAATRDGQVISAQRVVLALPPRLVSQMAFVPDLPMATRKALTGVPTWMAGQAKVIATYATPFWRQAGLSGNAISHHGPMVEVHDASSANGAPYALFGFIGVPPQARKDEQSLRRAIQSQLVRLFGPEASNPKTLVVKDWAVDSFTSTEEDHRPLYAHPAYGLPSAMAEAWGNRLIFSGTEVAAQFGGYVEGALEAADAALSRIEREG